MAFVSACIVATQWPFSIKCPTSSQWGIPRMLPLYPVESIVLSLTITAPTCFLSQVLLVATCFAMFMKYCSQFTLVILNYPSIHQTPCWLRLLFHCCLYAYRQARGICQAAARMLRHCFPGLPVF